MILTNPPFGGKEGKDAQQNFAFETGATQVLFVQKILAELAPGGSCAIVLDEGLLFRTNESAFVETKRKLTDECGLWAIVSLPGRVFSTAGAGVKTNLLFFTKGKKTERIWYYDLSWGEGRYKKTPLTLAHFGFAADGSVLDDAGLPAALVADWKADEGHAGQTFPSYARMLSRRGKPAGDSRYNWWTVDFAARRAEARAAMQPLQDQARQARGEAVELKERLRSLKKEKKPDAELRELIAALEQRIGEREKASRELEGQAAAIDAAMFDLKAVNPNAVSAVGTVSARRRRLSPGIEAQARIVADALGRLKARLRS
ncbi:N-6 DNA methylase [Rhodanobacter lindaniclasticus]